MGDDVTYSGWVFKEGSLVRSWKKRFMVVKGVELAYYASLKESSNAQMKGAMTIDHIEMLPDITNGIRLYSVEGRELKLFTETRAEFEKCFDSISRAVQSHSLTVKGQASSTHVGWLEKQGRQFHTWKTRYFVLQGNVLYYSAGIGTETLGYGRVLAVRRDYSIGEFGLLITMEGGRELRVRGQSEAAINDWLTVLSQQIPQYQSQQYPYQQYPSQQPPVQNYYQGYQQQYGYPQAQQQQYPYPNYHQPQPVYPGYYQQAPAQETNDPPSLFGPPVSTSSEPQPQSILAKKMSSQQSQLSSSDVTADSSQTSMYEGNNHSPREENASRRFKSHITLDNMYKPSSFQEYDAQEKDTHLNPEDDEDYSPTAPGVDTIRQLRIDEGLWHESDEESDYAPTAQNSSISGCCCILM